MHGVLHISYTMCTRGSPDIYTLSPRASGAYIRQTTRAHGITIKYILVLCTGFFQGFHSLYTTSTMLKCNYYDVIEVSVGIGHL